MDAISAGIQGVSNIIGGLLNLKGTNNTNKVRMQIAREQNAFNERMLDKQNQFNIDQWNRNNEYNTPLAQRQRYEEAGINPYFALGNIQGGNAQAVTSASAAPAAGAEVATPDYSFIGQAIKDAYAAAMMKEDIKGKQINNSILESQDTFMKSTLAKKILRFGEETDNIALQNEAQRMMNNITQQTMGATIEQRNNESKLSAKQLTMIDKQVDALNLDNDLKKQQRDEINPKQIRLLNEQIKNQIAQIYKTYVDANNSRMLTRAQCNALANQAVLTAAQTVGVEIQNNLGYATFHKKVKELGLQIEIMDRQKRGYELDNNLKVKNSTRLDQDIQWTPVLNTVKAMTPFVDAVGKGFGAAALLLK